MHTIFTVPADFQKESIHKHINDNNNRNIKIEEVYGSIKNSHYGAGRRNFDLQEVQWDAFCDYIKECNKAGIDFNYTLNASCMDNEEYKKGKRNSLIEHVGTLYDAGVRNFTIAIPAVADLIGSNFNDAKITLSIIAGIDTPEKLKMFSHIHGLKNVYIHEKLNRRPRQIKAITEVADFYGVNVGMIVNSFCLADCPYRQFHYNFTGHLTDLSDYVTEDYYYFLCQREKATNPRSILNASWIRPNDIQYFLDAGIKRFKLAGRERNAKHPQYDRVVDAYNARDYDGDITMLLTCFVDNSLSRLFGIPNGPELDTFMKSVFNGDLICNKYGCSNCNACEKVLEVMSVDTDEKNKWVQFCEQQVKTFLV
ncbi:MAG: hypothetical protein IJE43_16555 [Alphaproteobacteria bacterium]|nr:hypothetical protein [Alphaproteobacteria bacterium]